MTVYQFFFVKLVYLKHYPWWPLKTVSVLYLASHFVELSIILFIFQHPFLWRIPLLIITLMPTHYIYALIFIPIAVAPVLLCNVLNGHWRDILNNCLPPVSVTFHTSVPLFQNKWKPFYHSNKGNLFSFSQPPGTFNHSDLNYNSPSWWEIIGSSLHFTDDTRRPLRLWNF